MNLLIHEKLGGEDRTEESRTHSKLTTSRIYFTGLAAVASQLPLFSIQYFWYLELFLFSSACVPKKSYTLFTEYSAPQNSRFDSVHFIMSKLPSKVFSDSQFIN